MKVSMIHRHNAVLGAACPADNIPLNEQEGWKRRQLTDRAAMSGEILFFHDAMERKRRNEAGTFILGVDSRLPSNATKIFKSSSVSRNVIRLGCYDVSVNVSWTTINHLPSRVISDLINTRLDSRHHAVWFESVYASSSTLISACKEIQTDVFGCK